MLEPPVPIGFDQALQQVRAICAEQALPAQRIALADALGCTLAQDFIAPHDQPPFANSAMDGFAVRGADLVGDDVRLRLIGRILAGNEHIPAVAAGECLGITTGAPMPLGADTVVVKEVVTIDDDTVRIPAGQRAGANVRAAGEDMRRGQTVLAASTRLQPRHLAVLAAFGQADVLIAKPPRVAIFSTGDEVLAAGEPLRAGHIYNSNGPMLRAQAMQAGAKVVICNHLRDDPQALLAALTAAARDCDLIITAGGVSMGEADFLPGLLYQHGRIHFWRVRMKPGLPILFGELAGTPLLGLPGNPVSTAVGFTLFAGAAMAAMQGRAQAPPWRAALAEDVRKRHQRTEFVRCRASTDADGVLRLQPMTRQGSGQLSGLAGANALARIPEDMLDPPAGTLLDTWLLDGGDQP